MGAAMNISPAFRRKLRWVAVAAICLPLGGCLDDVRIPHFLHFEDTADGETAQPVPFEIASESDEPSVVKLMTWDSEWLHVRGVADGVPLVLTVEPGVTREATLTADPCVEDGTREGFVAVFVVDRRSTWIRVSQACGTTVPVHPGEQAKPPA